MLHEEFDPVLLGRNRVRIALGNPLQDLNAGHIELIPARRALVGADSPFDYHARLLCEAFYCVEYFGSHRIFRYHTLNQPGAIAELGEEQFPTFPQVVEPASNGDGLAFVLADIGNRAYRG
jgi:hypothetical protein